MVGYKVAICTKCPRKCTLTRDEGVDLLPKLCPFNTTDPAWAIVDREKHKGGDKR